MVSTQSQNTSKDNHNNKDHPIVEAFKSTSSRLKAIGAHWTVFIRAVDRIVFTEEPVHVPDQKLIDEAVRLLTGDGTTKKD